MKTKAPLQRPCCRGLCIDLCQTFSLAQSFACVREARGAQDQSIVRVRLTGMNTGAHQTLMPADATGVPEDMSCHLLKVMEWDTVLASFFFKIAIIK